MIVFLLLLVVAFAIVSVYATGNTGTHDLALWQWHWAAVPDWVPVVLAAAVIGGLFLLYMTYSGLVHGVRLGSMRRRVTTRESTISDLGRENQRLREENARVRSELPGNDRGVAVSNDGSAVMVPREPVGATTASDRQRTTTPFRPRPTFGERVRAFFSGQEPAGY
jgi:uncharacterized integral membrane protein